ncbi:hypothetical protein DICSQDRAFT_164440 [Dichomitus squalens LYAD-421 SS1]|uniref:Uncharacterized protein n=1 Tax=Dichomitus squalens TaxID=114155 RepID=A0A4Q9QDW9_9APHY|nr:uncharacterized protein DICSQDRAFT_164440 [Dichomitus squalens LYAD-421 SS1]EJF66599.1 hypothetical protein DICSQDRAFT_164440 [Dichomitus squalens LYAD-421 SS1]TBU64954.1 hypothetical protein BD310DRAFT_972453 [Dichomitus squalens]
MPEVIDLVSGSESDADSSADSEVQFAGYHRDVNKSTQHATTLEEDGYVYAGFKALPQPKIPKSIVKRKKPEVISLLDSDDEEPQHKSQAELQRDLEREEEEDYVTTLAALDLDDDANWGNRLNLQKAYLEVNDEGDAHVELALSAAATAVDKKISERAFRRLAELPQDYFDLELSPERTYKTPHVYQQMPPPIFLAAPTFNIHKSSSITNVIGARRFQSITGHPSTGHLVANKTIHYAGGGWTLLPFGSVQQAGWE